MKDCKSSNFTVTFFISFSLFLLQCLLCFNQDSLALYKHGLHYVYSLELKSNNASHAKIPSVLLKLQHWLNMSHGIAFLKWSCCLDLCHSCVPWVKCEDILTYIIPWRNESSGCKQEKDVQLHFEAVRHRNR